MNLFRAAGPAVVALVILMACDREASPPELTPGVSLELAEYRARTLEDVRYELTFRIPETLDEAVTGEAVIRFRATAAAPVALDFRAPPEALHAVRSGGGDVAYDFTGSHIVIPAEAVRAGENRIHIDFTAGDGSLNRQREFLYTLLVPDRAATVFPSFDQPDMKATFTLALDLPAGWQAVTNARTASHEVRDGRGLYRFRESDPLSTYQFAFAAGRFRVEADTRGSRRMHMYHREPDAGKVARNRDAIFDLHATALDWLEEYTGIPYPYDKFDFVLIPGFQYGGMEHPGAVFYREGSLLLDEAATRNQMLGRASLIAHETAHMWFGNLVTMRWFDDVWTKEVFANFMAARIVHPSFPDIDHELRFLLAHHPAAYAVDRTEGANPIRQPLDNLLEAGTLYGPIIYQKAPVVMRQLEALMGEDAFRDGIREYLDVFSHGNATWNDLIRILDARTREDLRSWSRIWVEESGRPEIAVELQLYEGGRVRSLELTQTDPAGRRRSWTQRVGVGVGLADGVHRIPVDLRRVRVRVPDANGLPAPRFVLPDVSGTGYGRLVLDASSRAYLLEHLPSVEDPLARAVAWLALWDGVLEGDVAPAAFLALARRALEQESEELLIPRYAADARAAFWRLVDPAARERVAPGLEAMLWRRMEAAESTTLKATFFNAYRGVAFTSDAVDRLYAVWSGTFTVDGLPLSEQDRTDLALALALRLPDRADAILDAQATEIRNPDRLERFQFVRPAVSPDLAVREAFFASLADPRNRRREPWVLEGLGYLHHPLRAEAAAAFVRPSLEMLEEIQRTGDIFFPKRWLDATLDGHASPVVAAEVRAFLDANPELPHRLRGILLQSADGLFRAAALRNGR